MKKCKCEWCDDIVLAKGYCGKHYQQIDRWGECRRTKRDPNQYIIYDDYAEIVMYDKELNEKARAIIDIDDVDKCKPYRWTLRNDGYVSSRKGSVATKLHRLINETPKAKDTDHINLNKLDNRKSNLKTCTQQENNKNKGKYKNNKSGFRGVLRVQMVTKVKYTSEIRFEGKTYYLGSFDTLEEAIQARREGEMKFYGYILDEK